MGKLLKSNLSLTLSNELFSFLPDTTATFFHKKIFKLHQSLNCNIAFTQTESSQLFYGATFD